MNTVLQAALITLKENFRARLRLPGLACLNCGHDVMEIYTTPSIDQSRVEPNQMHYTMHIECRECLFSGEFKQPIIEIVDDARGARDVVCLGQIRKAVSHQAPLSLECTNCSCPSCKEALLFAWKHAQCAVSGSTAVTQIVEICCPNPSCGYYRQLVADLPPGT